MCQNNKYTLCDDNTISSKFLSSSIKHYHQFCTMHGLKQLIKSPTPVTCSTSTLIDHILASSPSRVSQKGAIDVRISDHQLIFYKWKISCLKTGRIHKYFNFGSFKKHTVNHHKEALKQLNFLNYKTFDDANGAYSNFFQKILAVTDKMTPYRTQENTQKWIDNEVLEKFNATEKLFKNSSDFKNFFSNLAKSLITKFPKPPDKCHLKSVIQYY